MKPYSFKFTCFVFLSVVPLGLQASQAAPVEDRIELTAEYIDRLLVEAQGNNPSIQAAGARAEAASAAVDSVRTWQDPTLTLGLSLPTARGFKSSEEGNLIYGVEQKLPVFDRPKFARQVAEADAQSSGGI
jgi:outer membrane protein TolC